MTGDVRLTHVGGPTVLIEVGGWRLLTDPTFDAPGRRYYFGWGVASRKLTGPAIARGGLGPIDAVLLSHDHHDDNLDPAGRALLPSADVVITTTSGAARLGMSARGLEPWQSDRARGGGRPSITITATPCRHGPRGLHFIFGDVIGFALRWNASAMGRSGSPATPCSTTGCERSPNRIRVDTALLHLGGVRFGVTGPVRYTMTAREAVELCRLVRPATAIPIHYEGWKHFRQGRAAIEREFERAPEDIRSRIRWLPVGVAAEVGG